MGKEIPPLGFTVARNLSRWMSARGLLDRDIEKLCGVGHKTVNNMRNGRHAPELDNIEKVAAALRIQPWMLLVPGLDDMVFTEEELKHLIENYVAAAPTSRTHIAGMAQVAAQAANQRKAG